jgi:mannitol/fructose-specific phosphotransferase system IIA component (Ntr-type)/Kef-type K+ transport system membrane component KefB
MIALGLVILGAHLCGRVCRFLRISEVTGQLLGGALVGPFALHGLGILPESSLLYDQVIDAFNFFIFAFLSLVAFGIGEELHLSRLKRVGRKALIVAAVHGLLTWALITFAFLFFTEMAPLKALLLGSTGIASAPAVTFVLMNRMKIEGHLRHMLAGVVVLADLLGIAIFSLLLQVTLKSGEAGGPLGPTLLVVAEEVAMALFAGASIWAMLRVLVFRRARSMGSDADVRETPDTPFLQRILAEHPSPSGEILLIVLGAVSLGCGVAYLMEWPFLITAIFAGFLVANLHSHAIFDSLKIEGIAPIFNLIFFALMGSTLAFDQIRAETAWFAFLYIGNRMMGKLLGVWLGSVLSGEDLKIRACLPALLLPQAGVAAVEAVYASAILGDPQIAAIVLPAIVFFQIAGVYLTERSLIRWRSWVSGEKEVLESVTPPSGPAEAAQRILESLSEQHIRLGLQQSNKNDVIAHLVEHAIKTSPEHIDHGQTLQVIGERERLSPTGMGHGIALPHCRLMGLEQPVLIFARHEEGVPFGGVDDSPCDLIFLMLSPARKPATHLKLLAALSHLLTNEETRRELRVADSAEEILEVIQAVAHPDT